MRQFDTDSTHSAPVFRFGLSVRLDRVLFLQGEAYLRAEVQVGLLLGMEPLLVRHAHVVDLPVGVLLRLLLDLLKLACLLPGLVLALLRTNRGSRSVVERKPSTFTYGARKVS